MSCLDKILVLFAKPTKELAVDRFLAHSGEAPSLADIEVICLVGASDWPGVQGTRETPHCFLLLELTWLDEDISPPTLKRSVEESTLTKEIVSHELSGQFS